MIDAECKSYFELSKSTPYLVLGGALLGVYEMRIVLSGTVIKGGTTNYIS